MKHIIIEEGVPRLGHLTGSSDDVSHSRDWTRVAQYSSNTREDVQITIYCNHQDRLLEEGKLEGVPINVVLEEPYSVLVGPLVVIGCGAHREICGLTDDEIAQVRIVRREDIPFPILDVDAEDVSFDL